jgi:hypothetical protein
MSRWHGFSGRAGRSALAALVLAMLAGFGESGRVGRDPTMPQTVAHGSVYADRDGDARRDDDEPGLAAVKVSNGREVVTTDEHGRYAVGLRPGDTVFVIRPPHADLSLGSDGLPRYWLHHFPDGSPPLKYGGIAAVTPASLDFALRPHARGDASALTLRVFGDPQVGDARDLDWFERDLVRPLRGRDDADLGLSLGDIADDDLSLYPQIRATMASLGLPWLHLPGNHDLDFDAHDDATSLLSWRAAFGPDTFAWEDAHASLVLLDDVIYRPGQSPAYVGGLREDQFTFLENYLATLPRDRRVVLAAHIPFHDKAPGQETFRRADRERLFALLQPFRSVLLLTAHAHAQRHYFHGKSEGWHGAEPLHEYVVGAACGGFWSGLPDADGIPDARMEDGTPNGYANVTLAPDRYRLRWHVARDASDTRLSLHAPRVLRRGAYPAFAVSANVYMGLPDTQVDYRIDGGEWKPMTRVAAPDPALVAINVADDAAEHLRSFDRAVGAVASTHLWRGVLPTDLASGEHRVEVRAFDRWDGELRAATRYRLEQFDPPR